MSSKKMLVVYYIWSNGNTERIAEQLANVCDADLERIETIEPYPADYDVIAVGTPTWWYTMAPAVKTFLAENDLAGKTVVAFQTNGGWSGSVIDDIEGACAGAAFGPSMEVQFDSTGGDEQVTPQADVDAWIERVKAL